MFGEEEKAQSEAIPENEYVVVLNNVTVDLEGSAPRNIPFVNAQFEVAKGEYKQTTLWKRFYFSDGTAAKFLPWQMGVMGIKTELDEADCKSHQETAQKAMELMGGLVGTGFNVNVEINDGGYNDLVIASTETDLEDDTPTNKAPQSAPPKMDEKEELPF